MPNNSPIQLRDPDGSRRKLALRVGKRHGIGDVAGAIDFALNFTDAAERTEKPPLDYKACDMDSLRYFVAYGYDHYTRSAALAEIERRYQQGEAQS